MVYAAGLFATKALYPMQITGRGTEPTCAPCRGEQPAAYLGITIPRISELLLYVRPGDERAARRQPDPPSECQMRYISDALDQIDGGTRSDRPRPEKYCGSAPRDPGRAPDARVAQPSVKNSFYKNAAGEITASASGASFELLPGVGRRKPTSTISSCDRAKRPSRPRVFGRGSPLVRFGWGWVWVVCGVGWCRGGCRRGRGR